MSTLYLMPRNTLDSLQYSSAVTVLAMALRVMVLFSLGHASRVVQSREIWEPAVVQKKLLGELIGPPLDRDSGSSDMMPTSLVQPEISPIPDALWPMHTSHRCVGVRFKNQTCHFENLVYNTDSAEFVYYPAPDANMCGPLTPAAAPFLI